MKRPLEVAPFERGGNTVEGVVIDRIIEPERGQRFLVVMVKDQKKRSKIIVLDDKQCRRDHRTMLMPAEDNDTWSHTYNIDDWKLIEEMIDEVNRNWSTRMLQWIKTHQKQNTSKYLARFSDRFYSWQKQAILETIELMETHDFSQERSSQPLRMLAWDMGSGKTEAALLCARVIVDTLTLHKRKSIILIITSVTSIEDPWLSQVHNSIGKEWKVVHYKNGKECVPIIDGQKQASVDPNTMTDADFSKYDVCIISHSQLTQLWDKFWKADYIKMDDEVELSEHRGLRHDPIQSYTKGWIRRKDAKLCNEFAYSIFCNSKKVCKVVISDEGHKVGSMATTKRVKYDRLDGCSSQYTILQPHVDHKLFSAVYGACSHAFRTIMLSGTPCASRPEKFVHSLIAHGARLDADIITEPMSSNLSGKQLDQLLHLQKRYMHCVPRSLHVGVMLRTQCIEAPPRIKEFNLVCTNPLDDRFGTLGQKYWAIWCELFKLKAGSSPGHGKKHIVRLFELIRSSQMLQIHFGFIHQSRAKWEEEPFLKQFLKGHPNMKDVMVKVEHEGNPARYKLSREIMVQTPSSKMMLVRNFVNKVLRRDTTSRVVLISQWTEVLDLFKSYLESVNLCKPIHCISRYDEVNLHAICPFGFHTHGVSFDGRVHPEVRSTIRKAFKSSHNNIRCMYLSLKTGGESVNFVADNSEDVHALNITPDYSPSDQVITRFSRVCERPGNVTLSHAIHQDSPVDAALRSLQIAKRRTNKYMMNHMRLDKECCQDHIASLTESIQEYDPERVKRFCGL